MLLAVAVELISNPYSGRPKDRSVTSWLPLVFCIPDQLLNDCRRLLIVAKRKTYMVLHRKSCDCSIICIEDANLSANSCQVVVKVQCKLQMDDICLPSTCLAF